MPTARRLPTSEAIAMSQARQMTIALDKHMRLLEAGAVGRDRDGQIEYWQEIIRLAKNIHGWFGVAIADRARWKIRNLHGGA